MAVLALIRRDLLTVLRSKRAFAMLVGVVVFTIGFELRQWPQAAGVSVSGAAMTQLSGHLLRVLTFALFLGGMIALTPLAAASIANERERNTWSALRLALVSTRGIVFAKMVSLLTVYTLLIAGCLPVLGVIFFLVGVSWQELIVRLLVAYTTVFAAASCGIYCSARFSRTVVAVLAGFSLTIIISSFLALVVAVLRSVVWTVNVQIVHLLPGIGAGFTRTADGAASVLYAIAAPIFYLAPGFMPASPPLVGLYAALWQALLGLMLLLATTRRLRHSDEAERVPKHRDVLDQEALTRRRKQFPYYLIDPRKELPPIEDLSNPVMVKELRWGLPGRAPTLVRIGYAMLIVDLLVVGALLVELLSAVETVHAAGLYMTIASCLVIPLLLANSFTKEYEQDNVDMLRMTLVMPAEVVQGKLLGGAVILAPLMAPGVVLLLIICLVALALGNGMHTVAMTAAALVTFAVSAWICLSVSLLASVIARRMTTALLLAYALCFTIFAGMILAFWFTTELSYTLFAPLSVSGGSDENFVTSAGLSPFDAFMVFSLEWARPLSIPWYSWVASMAGVISLGRFAYRRSIGVFTQRFYAG